MCTENCIDDVNSQTGVTSSFIRLAHIQCNFASIINSNICLSYFYLLKVAAEIARKAQPTGSATSGTRSKISVGKTQHKKQDRQQNSDADTQKKQSPEASLLHFSS